MEIDVESLLAEFDGDSPCGEDLEYDPDFVELETIAKPKEEQQVGDSVIAGEDVDFSKVASLALGILTRSKDFRAAIYLAEASLQTDGFVAFERCLAYISGLADRYWDCAHPELDEEDDDDPTMRVNAMRGLVGPDTMLRAVRRAPLTDSKMMGRWSLRDIAVASGEQPVPADMDAAPENTTISAAFQDTDPARMAEIREAVAKSRTHLEVLTALYDIKVGTSGPDFSALDDTLAKAQNAINAALGDGAAPADIGAADADTPARAAPAGGGGGAVNSNEDVKRMIDRICDYYARAEPSSPVPILLNRARRLVAADFLTIMKDMASDGVDQVNKIGGLEDDDGY